MSTCIYSIYTYSYSCTTIYYLSLILYQARQSLEKTKTVLEEERQSLTSEVKSLQASRTESERGRKRAENQLQELSARMTQAEREREEREERIHKLQVQQDEMYYLWTNICEVVKLHSVTRNVSNAVYVSFSVKLSLSLAICPHAIPKPFVLLKRLTAWKASCMMYR